MSKNTMALFRSDREWQLRAREQIEPMIPPEHRRALPWTMFLRMAAHQLEGKEFDANSLITALLTFAVSGILPNKYLHLGYLIPYKDRKKGKTIVTPVFGYQGLLHLAYRARGENEAVLLDVKTGLVLRDDEYDDGGEEEIVRTHRVRTDRNPTVHPGADLVLAYARFRYGVPIGPGVHEYECIQVSRPGEIAAVDTKSNVWASHPQRMMQKTPIRRACASGRIELGYLAGLALTAEGQAARGDVAGYAQTVQVLASERGVEHNIEGIITAVKTDTTPKFSSDEYLKAATPIHERLAESAVTYREAEDLMVRLGQIAESMGAPDGYHDRIAEKHFKRAGRQHDTEQAKTPSVD